MEETGGIRALFLFLLVIFATPSFASSSGSSASTFKLLQLNAWMLDIPFLHYSIAKDIDARTKILPDVVAKLDADIIVFQEVWPSKIRKKIIAGLRTRGYPYSVSKSRGGALRGMLGNGLLIVSKFPLDSKTQMMKFSEYTAGIEFFCYKGAIKTRVQIPTLGWIDLYDSHLGAIDFDSKTQEYKLEQEQKKTEQARELAKWIENTHSENIQILSADLNSHYRDFANGAWTSQESPVHQLMTDLSTGLGLVDTFHWIHGYPEIPDCTYCQSNPYAAQGLFGNAPSEVEDYIFVSPNEFLTPVSSEIVLQEDLSTDADLKLKYHLQSVPNHITDHYGLLTTFRLGATSAAAE